MALDRRIQPYYEDYDAAVADAGVPPTPIEFLDRDLGRSPITMIHEVPATAPLAFVVPRPLSQADITVTVDGNARTLVFGGEPAAGQVSLDPVSGVTRFHSSDAGEDCAVTLTPAWTNITAGILHRIQGDVAALADELTLGLVGSVVYVDSVSGNDTTGNGSATAPFATLGKAVEYIDGEAGTEWVVRLGVGEYEINGATATLLEDAGNKVFLAGAGRDLTTVQLVGWTDWFFDDPLFNFALGVRLVGADRVSFAAEGAKPDPSEAGQSGTTAVYQVGVGSHSGAAPQFTNCGFVIAGGVTGLITTGAFTIASGQVVPPSPLTGIALNCNSGDQFALDQVFSSNVEQVTQGGIVRDSTITGNVTAGEVRDCVVGGNVAAENIHNVRIVSTANRSVTSWRVCEGLHLETTAAPLVSPGNFANVYLSDFTIIGGAGGNSGSILRQVPGTAQTKDLYVRNGRIIYSGPYDEASSPVGVDGPGKVSAIAWRNTEGTLDLDNVQVDTTGIGILMSHPSDTTDPGRDTLDQNLKMRGCKIRSTMLAQIGAPDTTACVSIWGRGTVDIDSSNELYFDGRLGTNAAFNYACIAISRAADAGTRSIVLDGPSLEFYGSNAAKDSGIFNAPIILRMGQAGVTMDVEIPRLHVIQRANTDATIQGAASQSWGEGSIKLGTIHCNEAPTIVGATAGDIVRVGTTEVNNLKVVGDADGDFGGGSFDPAAPGAIGGTTPAAGTFTTLVGTTVRGKYLKMNVTQSDTLTNADSGKMIVIEDPEEALPGVKLPASPDDGCHFLFVCGPPMIGSVFIVDGNGKNITGFNASGGGSAATITTDGAGNTIALVYSSDVDAWLTIGRAGGTWT